LSAPSTATNSRAYRQHRTDRRYPRLTCHTAAAIPKAERPRHPRLYLFLLFVHVLRSAWLGRHRCLCAGRISRAFSASTTTISLLTASENDTGSVINHHLRCSWSPLCHEPCQPAPGVAIFRQWRRKVLVLSLSVWFWRRAPRWRPASAPAFVFIVGAECQLVLFVVDRTITVCEPQQPRRADRVMPASPGIKALALAAEVVFGRSCEAREPCMLRCSFGRTVRRRAGSVDKGTDEVLGCDAEHESQISAFPQVTVGPRHTVVGNILPLSLVEVHPRSAVPYHLLRVIFPEGRVSVEKDVIDKLAAGNQHSITL